MKFAEINHHYRTQLLASDPVDVGEWHSMVVQGNPMLVTMELPHVSFEISTPDSVEQLQSEIKPNLPWAEDHFMERIGGKPLNPAPSHRWWPWNHSQHHDENEVFSHTYPERFWPKMAGQEPVAWKDRALKGIRFTYGDLDDVVDLLVKSPYTRQAYLPVWFPEDTGGGARLDGARVPCSLGYHFLYRNGALDCTYYMRSCDFVRHFRDDVYMAARLQQYVARMVGWKRAKVADKGTISMAPGRLLVHISSLHAMEGDRYKMTEEIKNGQW